MKKYLCRSFLLNKVVFVYTQTDMGNLMDLLKTDNQQNICVASVYMHFKARVNFICVNGHIV